jgi:hypothetical protein
VRAKDVMGLVLYDRSAEYVRFVTAPELPKSIRRGAIDLGRWVE